MFLKFLLSLVLLLDFVKQNVAQEELETCEMTESFTADVEVYGLWFNKTFNSCVTDQNMKEIRLLTHVQSFKANTFVNMPLLNKIDISNQGVGELWPGFIKNVPNLKVIEANNNRITHVKKGVFNYLNLTILDLRANNIFEMETGAFHYLNCSDLLLGDNKLTKISNDWFHYSWIMHLHFDFNKITDINKDSFKGLVRPEIINLSDNKIHFIHDRAFSGNVHWKILDLRMNSLTSIKFLNNTKVDYVDLGYNLFSNLRMEKSMDIDAIKIYPNPWNCECLFKFWRYAWKHGITYTDYLFNKNNKLPVCIASGDCDENYIDPEAQQIYFEIRQIDF